MENYICNVYVCGKENCGDNRQLYDRLSSRKDSDSRFSAVTVEMTDYCLGICGAGNRVNAEDSNGIVFRYGKNRGKYQVGVKEVEISGLVKSPELKIFRK